MPNVKSLREQVEKCLLVAQTTTDSSVKPQLETIARNITRWVDEAVADSRRKRDTSTANLNQL